MEDIDQKGSESGTNSNSEKPTQGREQVTWAREDFGTKWSVAQWRSEELDVTSREEQQRHTALKNVVKVTMMSEDVANQYSPSSPALKKQNILSSGYFRTRVPCDIRGRDRREDGGQSADKNDP